MRTQLSEPHRSTYDGLFRHPVDRKLYWRDVRALLEALAAVEEDGGGSLKITRNGQRLVIRPIRAGHMAKVEEIMEVRRFLERSDAKAADTVSTENHMLLVIDHRQARIYKTELHGSVPERITPYDAGAFGRHLQYVQDDSNGQPRLERKNFYDAVARTLRRVEKVLVFGSSTGASSAMGQLLIELKHHHPEVAKHIVGSIVMNEQHMTDDQLLAKAREFYAAEIPKEAETT